jgi:hypothetical protein
MRLKIAIKNKSEMKYIDSAELKVGDISLLELYSLVSRQQDIIKSLLDQIKDSHIVKKDTAYIIKLGNELKEIDKLEIVAVEELKYPLRFYELEDGQLKLDKRKVVAL